MHLRRFLIIIVILFFTSEFAFATGGSAYSRFGIGERQYLASVRSIGMGGASIALRGANHFNVTNPASWSDMFVVQFSGSFYYENITSNDGISTDGIATGSINGAMIGLPVMPSRGMTLAFGFAPMTRVGYNIETLQEIEGGFQSTKHIGSGGITNIIAGTSYRFNRDFSIGAMALYRMGILNYEWSNQYSISGYGSAFTLRELDIDGIAGQFGLMYSGLLPQRREGEPGPLSIGVVFTTPSVLDVKEDYTLTYGTGLDTTTTRTGTIELPYTLGIGVGYRIDRSNLIAVDVRYEPWEDFRKFGNPDNQMRNSLRLGVGWERQGNYEETGISFWERSTFRVGFLYNASYFNIRDNPINETFFTFGMGFPLSGSAILDVGAQIGVRGTTDNNLQRDTMFRLYFSLNMFERWFVPPRIE